MLWTGQHSTFVTSDADKVWDRLLRATPSICPHDEAVDYQVGCQRYYPHPPRLYSQPSCRANGCWHDNQQPILLLPTALDLSIALYEDSTYDVDLLYDKFAKYETRRKLADLVAGKAEKTTDDSLALFGQQASSSSSKNNGKRRGRGRTTTTLPAMDAVKRVTSRGNARMVRRRMRSATRRRTNGTISPNLRREMRK